MAGKVCERCGKGTYEIADLNDEIQSERHCIMCGHFTKLWKDGWTVNRTDRSVFTPFVPPQTTL